MPRASAASNTPSNASPAPVASTSTTGSAAHLHERTLERHRRPLLAELHACDPVALTEGSGGCRARHTRQDLGLSLVGQEHVRTGFRSSPRGTARRRTPRRAATTRPPPQRTWRFARSSAASAGRRGGLLQQEVAGDEDGAGVERRRQVVRREARVRAAIGHHGSLARLDDDEHGSGRRVAVDGQRGIDAALHERVAEQPPRQSSPTRPWTRERRHRPMPPTPRRSPTSPRAGAARGRGHRRRA